MGEPHEPIGLHIIPNDFTATEHRVADAAAMTIEGRIAVQILERCLTAGQPGPEDSQGRATLVLQPVAMAVERSIEAAESVCREMRARGWLVPIPAPIPREDRLGRRAAQDAQDPAK